MMPAERSSGQAGPSDPRWMGQRWTAWMPLMAAHPLALAQLPSVAGAYRLRRVDRPGQILGVYPAEGGVRQTVERLSRQTHLPLEPYDDPAAPARLLWRGRTNGLRYDVSGVVLPPDEDVHRWAERLTAVAFTFESVNHAWHPTDDTSGPVWDPDTQQSSERGQHR